MKRQTVIGLIIFAGVAFASLFFYGYQVAFTPNLATEGQDRWVYIRPGDDFQAVYKQLQDEKIVHDGLSFAFLSKLVGYQDKVLPGGYLIKKNSSNLDALKVLKGGHQTPVKVTFNNIRLKSELVQQLGSKLMFGPDELRAMLTNPDTCQYFGFDTTTVMAMFVPNTYEFYWNTSASKFVRRMHSEYRKFWNNEREEKARAIGFTPVQATILASIVEEETHKPDEMPCVAGVYKNRLDANMRLQADPTVKYAVGDFSIKRVLHQHLAKNSPYNTYMYKGLPPGPIRVPSTTAIDAVLKLQNHKYMYFCAKEDFSGYHNFAEDYSTHLKFAAAYQKALDQLNIR